MMPLLKYSNRDPVSLGAGWCIYSKVLYLPGLVVKVRVVLHAEDARLDELSHLPALR